MICAVNRPWNSTSGLPVHAVRGVVTSLQTAGADARFDFEWVRMADLGHTISDVAAELSDRWAEHTPELVHAFGVVAAAAALTAGKGAVPIVATFHESPVDDALETALARQVDGVLPLSVAERRRWRAAGARTTPSGVLRLPATVNDPDACARDRGGHVITFSTGPALDAAVESMPRWSPNRLVVLGPLSTARRHEVESLARSVGVRDRLVMRPGLSWREQERFWAGAALLLSGTDGARHAAHVLDAAVHGVPAVAVAHGAHLDCVVPGSTGVLVDPAIGSRGLGRVVAALVRDPLRTRGYGAAALVRARSVSDPGRVGLRLLDQYHELLDGGPSDAVEAAVPIAAGPRLPVEREHLVLSHLTLAHQLAHRYANRGQSLDDLVQVASLGLVKAAVRFDPEAGTEFPAYAVPTILGELRRHFRDHAWAVRVPRALQETTLEVQRVSERLQQRLGSESSAGDVAAELGITREEVLLARRTRGEAMTSQSLDLPVGEEGTDTFGDLVGAEDDALARVEDVEGLRAALRALPAREREILVLRFYGDRTQSEIAEMLGISQVHVSRLLTRTLAALRDHVLHEIPLPASWTEEPEQEPAVEQENEEDAAA